MCKQKSDAGAAPTYLIDGRAGSKLSGVRCKEVQTNTG